jgi:hypothetical protein
MNHFASEQITVEMECTTTGGQEEERPVEASKKKKQACPWKMSSRNLLES